MNHVEAWPCYAKDLGPIHLGKHVAIAGEPATGRLMQVSFHESRPTICVRLLQRDRSIVVIDVAHDAIITKRAAWT